MKHGGQVNVLPSFMEWKFLRHFLLPEYRTHKVAST